MKKIFLLPYLVLSVFIFSQKTELRASLNSGLLSFKGNSAENVSFINSSTSNAYTNNPYGTISDLGLGISLNYKYILTNNLFFGADLGYENLKSKLNINQVIIYGGFAPPYYIPLEANGKTNIIFNNFNIEPFLGYRIPIEKINFDVTGGVDFGFILSAKEKGSAFASDGKTYATSLDRKTISMDFRPRIQLDINYQKFGVFLGYSFGIVNYYKDYDGGNPEAKSKILRFGLTYQIK